MIISQITQNEIDRIFAAPMDYDNIVVESGDNTDEPKITLKAFNEGLLVYYINYDILDPMGFE